MLMLLWSSPTEESEKGVDFQLLFLLINCFQNIYKKTPNWFGIFELIRKYFLDIWLQSEK